MLPKYYDNSIETYNVIFKFKRKIPIIGIKKYDYKTLCSAVNSGERFVIFNYAISLLFFTATGTSSIYFGKNNLLTIIAKIWYSLISSLALILTILFFSNADRSFMNFSNLDVATVIMAILVFICVVAPIPVIISNIIGGEDVTNAMMEYIKNKENETK